MMDNPSIPEPKSKKKRKSKKKGASSTTNNTSTPQPTQNTSKPEDEESNISEPEDEQEESDALPATNTSAATSVDEETVPSLTNGTANASISTDITAATARFDALVRDRDALREEVTRLRQSLEEVQSNHERQIQDFQTQLQDSQAERETAEENYQNLLGKVNTIRSQLGERLKADAEDLAQARTQIDELEQQKSELQQQSDSRATEISELKSRTESKEKELEELRKRSTLATSNWQQERDELVENEKELGEELENAKQAMHDWEVLAMEERSIRRDLSDRVSDLEEQLAGVQREYERAASERDSQNSTVDGLQRAMQEIQNARKKELRELVESSQRELAETRKQWEDAKAELKDAHQRLESTQKELERALPFEKEVKEKNLLIGKLRHEAVILNDHLTKALRFLKKGKPEDNVDRQIVTNHFLHFLALDRSDPKKFQILQLIAALLGWTDEQKEQAGLQRAGGSTNSYSLTGSLRLPGTPMMHKTPSSPALSHLNQDFLDAGSPSGKESLAELWQNFLEQEAGSSGSAAGTKSRTASMATSSGLMSPGLPLGKS